MAVQVLGISGSPIRNSNTDRTIRRVLEATGLEWDFIKLSDFHLDPCRACLGCVRTNTCILGDDGAGIAEKFKLVKAFVLGGFTPYSSLDARTKTFMERMYCLRHLKGYNRGKHGALVLTTACEPGKEGLPPAAEIATSQVAYWMMEEGMHFVGHMVVTGNVPCIKCGFGDTCDMSAIKMLHGADATVADVGVQRIEEDRDNLNRARELGQHLRESVLTEQLV